MDRAVASGLVDGVVAALGWWLEGLWVGLPAAVRARFRARSRVTAWIDGAQSRLDIVGGNGERPELRLDASAGEAGPRELGVDPDADVTLVLPRGVGLMKTLRLPLSAEPALREVLSHELDRLTPFSADEIAFGYAVREREADKLAVAVALVRQASLDGVLAACARVGLTPERVTVADREGVPLPLDLSRSRPRLRLPFTESPVSLRIAGVAALALLVALYLPLWRYGHVLASYERATAEVRAQAVGARTSLTEQEAALARSDFMAARRASYVAPLGLLLELTRSIPEQTWLSRFSMTPDSVFLQGESAAAPDLLKVVEATERLQGAQFQTPLARADQSGKDLFTIVATLSRPAP